jgi:hypothetical protein
MGEDLLDSGEEKKNYLLVTITTTKQVKIGVNKFH